MAEWRPEDGVGVAIPAFPGLASNPHGTLEQSQRPACPEALRDLSWASAVA